MNKPVFKWRPWLGRHGRSLSFWGGLVIVTVWTIFRHITNGVNFDIVGQVGMAEQWTTGQHAGAQIGSTNYLLKMPLYWLINQLGFLNPHARLLTAALICNIATFVIIFLISERILGLYKVKNRSLFYIGFLWLATISGNVYWLEYANSRNLETASGLLLLYLALRYLEQQSYRVLITLTICATIVFFADPLQTFVIGLSIVIYTIGSYLVSHRHQHQSQRRIPALLAALTTGYILSQELFWIAKTILPVSFLRIPGGLPAFTYHNVSASFNAIGSATLKVFGADFIKRPYGFNSLRALLGFITLVGIIILLIRLIRVRSMDNKPKWLLLTVIITNYLVYAGTGQALQWATERYLIMLPLICLLLIGLWGDEPLRRWTLRLQMGWLLCLVLCSLLVAGALFRSWPTRFSLDTYIVSTTTFMQNNNYVYGFAARQTAIPASYFDGYHHTLLPLICGSDHRVHFSNLFFDKAPLSKVHTVPKLPIIVPSGGIQSDQNICTEQDLSRQLGAPETVQNVGGGATAFVYNSQDFDLRKL